MVKTDKDIIVCLIGESGCGKTTVAQILEQKGYNVIQSYTTRQAREKNEWGHTFADLDNVSFTDDFHAVRLLKEDRYEHIIAYVYYNNNHYWATREQYAGKGFSIYIIDPEGYIDLKQKVLTPIVGIYLQLPYGDRVYRLTNRDGYDKAKNRLENDEEAFRKIKTDWVLNVFALTPEQIASHVEDIMSNP